MLTLFSSPLLWILAALTFSGCGKIPGSALDFLRRGENGGPTQDAVTEFSGYWIISNSGTRNVNLHDPDGTFVRTLLQLNPATGQIPYGVIDGDDGVVFIVVDGASAAGDVIVEVDLATGTTLSTYSHVNLTGNLRGITRLSDGDYLVIETNTTERFGADWSNLLVKYGSAWPKTITNMAGATRVVATENAGFIQCAGTTGNRIGTYNNIGTLTASNTAASTATTTAVAACAYDVNTGKVAAAWNGTNDVIDIYTSTALLPAGRVSYSSPTILGNPQGVAFTSSGTVVAIDGTLSHVVEIDATTGGWIRTILNPYFSTATNIWVVP